MKMLLSIKFIAISFFLVLMMGCNSNHNAYEWLLTDNGLHYKNEAVDWRVDLVKGCEACAIIHDVVYQPEGVSRYSTLLQNQSWVAVYEVSKLNVIRLKLSNQTPYLFVERLKGQTLTLFNQQQNYNVEVGVATRITFDKQQFEILIKKFEEVDDKNISLPRRAILEFIALKADKKST